MKITKLLFLGLTTLVFWGCSSDQKTEIEYFDCENGYKVDYKTDCPKSIKNFIYLKKGEYSNIGYDHWVPDGLHVNYFLPGVIKDSTIYIRGEIKEKYSYYNKGDSRGPLEEVWIYEVIETLDETGYYDEKTGETIPDEFVIRNFPIKYEYYYESGQLNSRTDYVFDPGKSLKETTSIQRSKKWYYENGNLQRSDTLYEDEIKKGEKRYSNYMTDLFNEDGSWKRGYFQTDKGPINKKSLKDKFIKK